MKHQLKKFKHEIAILNFNESFKESFYPNLQMLHLPTILQEALCLMEIVYLFFHYNIRYIENYCNRIAQTVVNLFSTPFSIIKSHTIHERLHNSAQKNC